jgi:hypothetical protein
LPQWLTKQALDAPKKLDRGIRGGWGFSRIFRWTAPFDCSSLSSHTDSEPRAINAALYAAQFVAQFRPRTFFSSVIALGKLIRRHGFMQQSPTHQQYDA